VIASSVLLGLSGFARLAQVAAEAVSQHTYLSAHEKAGTPSGFGALPMLLLMGVGLVVALIALAILALALANLAGRNSTRVLTWVVGGATLTVSAGWLALSGGGEPPRSADGARVEAIAAQLMPGWVEPVSTMTGFVASPALLVAVVLLALPPANAFFRWRHAEHDPLYPGQPVRPDGGLARAS
jgi:4-amino-4-deoxy-L-arabinose transferase-like glycosyltransferase